jgi:tetratricopeptide (TPR) repeat protein
LNASRYGLALSPPRRSLFCAVGFALGVLSFSGARAEASNESYLNYVHGLSEERAGHMSKALEAYEKVVAEDPQALEVFKDIAQLNLRLGQADAAVRAAEKAKDLAPKDPSSFPMC